MEYAKEEELLVVVERNSGLFVIGSSAVFLLATLTYREVGIMFSVPAFVTYEALSLVFLVLVQLFPEIRDESSTQSLARLRRFKNVAFTYAVFLFIAALMVLVTAALR